MQIKKGDYVNGSRVEEVKMIDGELHCLIAYFDWEVNKPQCKWLPQHLVMCHVFAENFRKVQRHRRKSQ